MGLHGLLIELERSITGWRRANTARAMAAETMSFVDSLKKQIEYKMNEQPDLGFVEMVKSFFVSVNWSEEFCNGWLAVVFCLHLSLILPAFLFRKNSSVQIIVLVMIAILVGVSEPLNTWASANWSRFASVNYFDTEGVFAVAVWSGPLVFIALVVLFNLLRETVRLLILVKRSEFQQKAKEAKKED